MAGDGAASFRREKYIPFGGPNGGDGGSGGSIILKASGNLNTLIDYRYKQHFRIIKGENGKGKNRYGKSSEDCILIVPIGTQAYAEDGVTLLADLSINEQSVIIAQGGKGGLGNTHFKTSVNQAPRQITKGTEGEELWIWLKMKMISEVGIIGLPNAGKSTLLSVVSAAKPKIATYPFTTLKPQLGTVRVEYDSFVIADIPGLIEGASQGAGIGDRFLKHIERCNILLHLIDINSKNIYSDYLMIRNELKSYSSALADKHEIIVLNKIDLITKKKQEKIKLELFNKIQKDILLISCATKESVQDLVFNLNSTIKQMRVDSKT